MVVSAIRALTHQIIYGGLEALALLFLGQGKGQRANRSARPVGAAGAGVAESSIGSLAEKRFCCWGGCLLYQCLS